MFARSVHIITVVLVLGLAGSASAELIGYWKLDENSGANTLLDILSCSRGIKPVAANN